jgi:uncharacterized protein
MPTTNRLARFLLSAFLMASGIASAMTDMERDLLRDAARPQSPQQVRANAAKVASRLGKARDPAALDELLALRDTDLLRSFAASWGPATQEYEARVLRHFDDREIAPILIQNLRGSGNPAVFEALYRDAEMLAKWRADRRRDCRARIHAYDAGASRRMEFTRRRIEMNRSALISWEYVCRSTQADDFTTDLDGRPYAAKSRQNRESASVGAIAHNAPPGTEARLAMLFGDLSLYPPVDWSEAGGAGPLPYFPSIRLPAGFLSLFADRLYAPPVAPLLTALKEVVPSVKGARTDHESWSEIVSLHGVLVTTDSSEATRALAVSIERAAEIEKPEDRRKILAALIPLLGPVLPGAQIDMNTLKAAVLDRLPQQDKLPVAGLFKQAEADNQTLRVPSATSLTFWLRSIHWRRLFQYLLAHGANPNQPATEPPLLAAVIRNEAAALLLLDHGARVDVRGYGKTTALHLACRKPERAQLAALLIAKGADVNASNDADQTPLHIAAGGSPQCVRILLAAGAKPEAGDRLGRTPLDWAASESVTNASNTSLETARLLLDAGADPNRENKEGVSPFMQAYNRPDMKALLQAHGGRLSVAQEAKRAYQEMILRNMKSFH